MNENLNLVEILKDCPKGTKLYYMVYGEVEFEHIANSSKYPIVLKLKGREWYEFLTSDGKLDIEHDGECLLFPSKEQRDWSKFKLENPKKPKFDPKTLKPFDKVLLFNSIGSEWKFDFYSHKNAKRGLFECVGYHSSRVIPYNEETKHLVGTADEAPEYYRYWEE